MSFPLPNTYNGLLHALAWMQFLLLHDNRAEVTNFFLQVQNSIRHGLLGVTELDSLISQLRRQEGYQQANLDFQFDNGNLYLKDHFSEIRLQLPVPPERLIEELEKLQRSYEEAISKGVQPEKGLVDFFGKTLYTDPKNGYIDLIVMGVLACTQQIKSPEVAQCWPMVLMALEWDYLTPELLTDFVTSYIEPWSRLATENFFLDILDNGEAEVRFLHDTCLCPTQAIVDELTKLAERYYHATQ